jgi:hypothetical protein
MDGGPPKRSLGQRKNRDTFTYHISSRVCIHAARCDTYCNADSGLRYRRLENRCKYSVTSARQMASRARQRGGIGSVPRRDK